MNNTKIDHRKKYGIMIDTETANGLECPLFYDVGWQVIDSHGNKYIERSFVNADVFLNHKDLMNTCYYKDKLPNYWQDIKSGKRILTSMFVIREQLKVDCELYGCKFICAHNARFDYKALNGTQRYITKSKYRYFVPYGLEWWDTLAMARSLLNTKHSYLRFCVKHNTIDNEGVNSHLTKNGKPRFTAEIIYQYITDNPSFIESHMGLEDVDIERQILAWCKRQHKKMKKLAFNA